MRLFFTALLGAVLCTSSFGAQAAQDVSHQILRGKDIPVVPMAGWMDGTAVKSANGKDAVAKAPASASRYQSKTYKFPTGTVEILTAEKGGALLRQISKETQLYVIKGAGEVGVAGAPTPIAAGDAISRPTGVLHSTGADGIVIVAYSVGNAAPQPKSMIVHAKDVPDVVLGQWMRDGKLIAIKTAEEAAKAPPDAQIHLTKRYEFDGNSMRVPYWDKKKGSPEIVGGPAIPKLTALFYLWEGRGRFTYNGQVTEVSAGDLIEEEADVPHAWTVLETMRFVATDSLPGQNHP